MKQLFHEIKIKTNGQGFYNFTDQTISWLTKEILFLREYSETSFMFCPSVNILPFCC